jgi:hypothetical protein
VTVAANLNVEAWSQIHGYPTLKDSLDPAKQARINKNIIQLHFSGKNDKNTPSFIINNYSKKQRNATYIELPENDHTCCWKKEWIKILSMI